MVPLVVGYGKRNMKIHLSNYFKISISLGLIFFPSPLVLAQLPIENLICASSPEVQSLSENSINHKSKIISKEIIKNKDSIPPSLWWAKEQFDLFDGRLVTNWIADTEQKEIDIIVNRQLWSLLNYLERYRFVNKFGTVARENQYNLRIFNQQQKCLVTYLCDFQITPSQCKMTFESTEVTGFQIYQPKPGEFDFGPQ